MSDSCDFWHFLMGFSEWFSSEFDGFLALANANTSLAKKTRFLMIVSGVERQRKGPTANMSYSNKNKQVSCWEQLHLEKTGSSTTSYTARAICFARIAAAV